MSRGWTRSAFFLVVGIVWTTGLLAASDDAPFRVENQRLNLGRIQSGTEVVATFVFQNEGDTDVHIIRAKPS
jgi:hypothetical protein